MLQDSLGPGPARTAHDFQDLRGAMSRAAVEVDQALDLILPRPEGLTERIPQAMRYAIFAGGKRLRPFLALESAALFGVARAEALRTAAAIEALHTYSLVHDDLPCMDDDDLRRGRPTTHKAFDEATAVLAGDALLTVAFEILADPKTHRDAEVRMQLVSSLAQAGGAAGMIGGQMIDMLAPERDYDAQAIIELQRLKTGALFEFSAEAGAILGRGSADDRRRLRAFARDFGLAFQITDDLLDATGTVEQVGKAVGKDEEQGKATLLSIYGLDGARSEAEQLASRAVGALETFGPEADRLRALPYYLLERAS